ncbi:hypothetical protein V7087_29115 [Neobacillus niacini]|uniref:hypothetical protein n=1 Tax=Neobacillus niacini TaxID=86668 RepID=UPI002FFE9561
MTGINLSGKEGCNMQIIGLMVFIVLIPFVALSLLLVGVQILSSPIFWIILVLIAIGFIAFDRNDKKRKGYLTSTIGYIYLEGVDPSKMSILRLYPDKITINDIQTIPIDRVKKATFETVTRVFRGYKGIPVKEHTYTLTIHYSNREGKQDCFTCRSKVNQGNLHMDYMRMEQKINKLIGYLPPKENFPNKPYKL